MKKLTINEELSNIKKWMGILNEDDLQQQANVPAQNNQSPQDRNKQAAQHNIETIKNLCQSNGFQFVQFNGTGQQVEQKINQAKTSKELLGNAKAVMLYTQAQPDSMNADFLTILAPSGMVNDIFQNQIRKQLPTASGNTEKTFQKSDNPLELMYVTLDKQTQP